MRRRIFAVGLLALVTLLAAGWFLGYLAMPKQTVQALPANQHSVQTQSPDTQAVQAQSSGEQTMEAQTASREVGTAQPTSYVPTPPSIKGIDAALLKARWGFEFTPAEANVQPQITKEQALSKAYQCRPGTRQATSVVFELGYLRNPGMLEAAGRGEKVSPKIADPGLVWILVFEGYQSLSSGPAPIPGGPPTMHGQSNKLNIVISALTGECIEEIIYR